MKTDSVPRKCGCVVDLEPGTIVLYAHRSPQEGPQVVKGVSKWANRQTHLYDLESLHTDSVSAVLCSGIYIPRPENPCWPFKQPRGDK